MRSATLGFVFSLVTSMVFGQEPVPAPPPPQGAAPQARPAPAAAPAPPAQLRDHAHDSLLKAIDDLLWYQKVGDAAAVVEVIEHMDPPRLAALERVIFEHAKPETVVLTTPNAEYNVRFETLPAGQFRHRDHRFEWTRAEFQRWAREVAQRYGYKVEFRPVGNEDAEVGPPTQMGVFRK